MNKRGYLALSFALAFTMAVSAAYIYFSNGLSFMDRETDLRQTISGKPGDLAARMELARILERKESWPEAVVTLQDGLKSAPDDLDLHRQLAALYVDWYERTQNLKKLSQAERYLQRVLDSGQATVDDYTAMAQGQDKAGNHARAAEAYDEAVKRAPDDGRLRQLGHYARFMAGQYEESRVFYENLTEAEPENAWAWRMRGRIAYHLGNYDDAVTWLKRAVELATPEKKAAAQKNLDFALALQSTNKKTSFFTHYELAEIHLKNARADRAAAEYEAAVKISTAYKAYAARAYARMAFFASYMSNYDQELEYAQKAVDIVKELDEPYDLSFCYQQMAGIYTGRANREKDKFDEYMEKAIEACEHQLECSRRAHNGHMEIHAIAELARAVRKKDGAGSERAKLCRSQMAKYLPKEGEVNNCATASVLVSEALFLSEEKDYTAAEKLFKPAAEYAARQTDMRLAKDGPSLYADLMEIAYRQNDFDRAIAYGERSVELLNGLRALLGADEFRQKIGGSLWQRAFQALINCALKKGDSRAIFDYSEEYKAQALLELLGTRAKTKKGRERLLLARQDAPAQDDSGVPNTDDMPSSTRDLSIEQSHYPRLPEDTSGARQSIPSFDRAISCTGAQIQEIAGDFTFVSYGISEEGSLAVVLTRDAIESVELPVSATTVREAIDKFRDGLGLKQGMSRDLSIEFAEVPGRESAHREKLFKEAAETLWDILIEPVRPHFRTEILCICPDGILNYLPFEALAKNGRYLVQDYSIVYAPSATVLKYCMDREHTQRGSVLALGNPNLQNPAFRLFNAEDEVESLRQFFPRAEVFVGNDANERTVIERGANYDVLHFACHGELNLEQPMLTALRLSPDEQNDGYLHAGEIFDLDLEASLVVLSACNTGLGAMHSGNELMGLTRSFLYAGASSIVASLWTVDDRSTAMLMRAFYRNLGSMNKAEALRQAKLETLQEYPSPFHWAAFCLQGDYR
jgi:tetratricopeptide (TPR) repeat protein